MGKSKQPAGTTGKTPADSRAIISVRHLKVSFFTEAGLLQAVRGISFDLLKGEVLGIVGESGSGKSVTGLSLLNLLPSNGIIESGSILFEEKDVLEMDKKELRAFRGKKLGVVFQEPGRSFDPIYSIGKTLEETLLAHNPGLAKPDTYDTSLKLLKEVQIPKAAERLKNFPHQFSGGMLQRIMIAVSLASDPEVLIADEPTTALDVTIQAQIISLLMDLKGKRHLSIIFITHNLALLSTIADRIIVMYGGLVMERGRAGEVLGAPHHPYTRALLNSQPLLEDHYTDKKLTTIPGTIPDPLKPEPGCPFEPRCPLAGAACRKGIPDMLTTPESQEAAGLHEYRCIYTGVKT